MNNVKSITLDAFQPRDYQLPIIEAIEKKGYRRVLAIMPRRAGKDITAFNIAIRYMIRNVCVVYYIFPTYAQGKKILWDSLNNDGMKILDYIPAELIESKNGQEMKIKLVNGSLFQVVGSDNVDCFDDQTEILTEDGWKLFKDLDNDKVATLKDGFLEYEHPLKYVSYDYDGPMYSINSHSIDCLVTPNHRFYVRSSKGFYKFKDISDPTIRHDMIPSRCDWIGIDQDIFKFPLIETSPFYRHEIINKELSMEDFVALLGIFLSEGSTYQDHKTNRITISQTKPHIREMIKNLLERCDVNFCELKDRFSFENKQMYDYFSAFGKQHERYIPKDIKSLSKKYLQILFDWLMLGDGYRGKDRIIYYSTSKQLIDDVQEIVIKLGYSGNVSIKEQKQSLIKGRVINSKRILYELRVRTSEFKRLSGAYKKSYISQVNYTGKVYCVSVSSGVIKVRRNGKEIWSGNSLVGTNPKLCIFSEYALQDPRAFQYIRPILAGNEGLALFVSTPRGHNHLFDLYNIANQSPDWFCYKLTLDDTQHIPMEEIERDRDEGLMSEDLIQQEYYCSFALGIEGSFYTKYIDKMRISNQIGQVPWDSSHRVNTAWDIGVRDSTCIIFYQSIGQAIRIIDCYENNKEGLEHYKQILDSKPYSYAKHFAPHDIAVTEWGTGLSRLEKAKQLGINFEIKRDKQGRAVSALPDVSIMDGIEAVRSLFSRLWIDEVRCAKLIKALENYRQEYDTKRRIYSSAPLHNWSSHYSDATRYLALSLPKTRDGLSAGELDNIYARAVYGNQGDLPRFFRDTK